MVVALDHIKIICRLGATLARPRRGGAGSRTQRSYDNTIHDVDDPGGTGLRARADAREAVAAMMKYNEELQKAGAAGARRACTAAGPRAGVTFAGGKLW